MQSVSDASSKEITASPEFRQAIASITNTLIGFCSTKRQHLRTPEVSQIRDTLFWSLAKTAVFTLGPIHFIDRNLLRVANGTFEAAVTPSRHTLPTSVTLSSSFLSLFEAWLDSPLSIRSTAALHVELSEILGHCIQAKSAFHAKLTILKDCAYILAKRNESKSSKWMWLALVDVATKVFNDRPSGDVGASTETVTRSRQDYSIGSAILLAGLQHSDAESMTSGVALLQVVFRRSEREVGDLSVVLDMFLNFTKVMEENTVLTIKAISVYAFAVLKELVLHVPENELAPNHRIQEGFGRPAKTISSELYVECGKLLNQTLLSFYACRLASRMSDLIESLESLFETADPNNRDLLQRFREGLLCWVMDIDNLVFSVGGELCELAGPVCQFSFCNVTSTTS